MKTTGLNREYMVGDIFICPDGEEIKIKQIYPKGSDYATQKEKGYLIESSEIGEDNWLQYHLNWRIEGAKWLRVKVKQGREVLTTKTA